MKDRTEGTLETSGTTDPTPEPGPQQMSMTSEKVVELEGRAEEPAIES